MVADDACGTRSADSLGLAAASSAFQQHCVERSTLDRSQPSGSAEPVLALLRQLSSAMGGQNIFGSQGNVGRVLQQILCYHHILRSTSVRRPVLRVCETGFSGGHSSTVFLAALNDSNARYYGFDLGDRPHKRAAAIFINTTLFPGQLHVAFGRSDVTGEAFFRGKPSSFLCDMLSIDGDHTEAGALRDWDIFGPRLAPQGLVFFDDIGTARHPGMEGPTRAWQRLVAANNITTVGCVRLAGRTDIILQSGAMSRKAMRASRGFCIGMILQTNAAIAAQCRLTTR